MIQDLKYGMRGLYRRPISSVCSIFILAIELGITIAVFSIVIVYVVVLRGFPFDRADRFAMIYDLNSSVLKHPVSYPDFVDWELR